eukprot:365123-Chlamydomonas_euryale.AAC.6
MHDVERVLAKLLVADGSRVVTIHEPTVAVHGLADVAQGFKPDVFTLNGGLVVKRSHCCAC